MTTFQDTWDSTYEAIPADVESANLGANRIRDLKVNIRQRLAVCMSMAGNANDGKTLVDQLMVQASDPTLDATDGGLYAKVVTGVTELFYKDSSGNVIQITKVGGINNASIIPSTTAMLFAQTAAPTGWTKLTTSDNAALRVVSGAAGTGGTVNFTTAFSSQAVAGTVGGTAITEANLPAHTHYVAANVSDQTTTTLTASNYVKQGWPINNVDSAYQLQGVGTGASIGLSSSAGSGTTHTHSFTGTAINLAVKYVDAIIATKD